ncbi:MAG: hypothetical protein OXG69_05065, partial [bacterium]|nr:hypothetical protein [bacterium]
SLNAPKGTSPKVMQRPVPHAGQPDINGTRALRPQTLGCRAKVVRHGPTPAVNVDGDKLPAV